VSRLIVKFGLFAAVTVALTVVMAAQIAKIQFGDTYALEAGFDDVTGLHDGDDVKIAGVKVGQVSSIDTDEAGRAVVRLSIDEGVEVPEDTEAAVRWRNLLGQRIVYLYPGQSEALLNDGDEVRRTRSVVDIGALIDELGGVVSAVDPGQFNQLMTAIAGALDGNEARVTQLLNGAGSLLQSLGERDETIGQLLEDFNTVSGALASRDAQIRTMVENLALLSESFAANEGLLDSTLSELGRYSTSLEQVLTGNERELLSIVANLESVTDLVTDRIDTVEATLANFPGALDGLFTVTNHGEFITAATLCMSTGPPPCAAPTTIEQDPSTVLTNAPEALANMGPQPPPGSSGPAPPAGLPIPGAGP
jgi:phospholipid/cholesterol/gamma-HCH transport system substrate-binding protein